MNIKNVIIGVLVVIIIILGVKACHKQPDLVVTHTDTVSSVNTIHDTIPQKPVYIPIYIPGNVTNIPQDPEYTGDPSLDYGELIDQYYKLLDSLYSTNYTQDQIILRDSSGKNVGIVNISDSVRQNRIMDRAVDYKLAFPRSITTITNTITKDIEVKKNKFLIGGGLVGNPNDIISGLSADLLFQNKKSGIIGAGVIVDKDGKLNYTIHKYWKIGNKK